MTHEHTTYLLPTSKGEDLPSSSKAQKKYEQDVDKHLLSIKSEMSLRRGAGSRVVRPGNILTTLSQTTGNVEAKTQPIVDAGPS